jgi:hypothetical protein
VIQHACAPNGAAGLTGSSFPALGGHALCYADGRNATRLRAHNAACRALSMLNGCIKQELRDLPQHTSPAQSSTEGVVTDPAGRGSAGSVFQCEGLCEVFLEGVDDLGGLAAASVAADDCHVVLTQRLQQALPDLDHGELLPLGLPLATLSAVPPCFEAPQHLSALRLLQTVCFCQITAHRMHDACIGPVLGREGTKLMHIQGFSQNVKTLPCTAPSSICIASVPCEGMCSSAVWKSLPTCAGVTPAALPLLVSDGVGRGRDSPTAGWLSSRRTAAASGFAPCICHPYNLLDVMQ